MQNTLNLFSIRILFTCAVFQYLFDAWCTLHLFSLRSDLKQSTRSFINYVGTCRYL